MKRVILTIIPILIFCALFVGCASENTAPKEENSESGLYVIGVKSGTALSGDEADLVFTGDDIISRL